jgi:hypothetical protein
MWRDRYPSIAEFRAREAPSGTESLSSSFLTPGVSGCKQSRLNMSGHLVRDG